MRGSGDEADESQESRAESREPRVSGLLALDWNILLPLIAVFLLAVMNRTSLLGQYANGRWANVLGGAVVLTATVLGAVQVMKVFG